MIGGYDYGIAEETFRAPLISRLFSGEACISVRAQTLFVASYRTDEGQATIWTTAGFPLSGLR